MSLDLQTSNETLPLADGDTPRSVALKRCDDQINWYTWAMNDSSTKHNLSQVSAIFLGGITPVLVVLQVIFEQQRNLLTVLIALFPALAAIITGLNTAFVWKDNYIRFAYTTEALKSEKIKYQTRTTRTYGPPLTEQQALSNFVRRTETITLQETIDWKSRVKETIELEEAIGLVDSKLDS
jgi:hypothetical protein